MTETNKSGSPLVVCGIGASAGGLEALKKLFSLLKPNEDVAFLVAQHLSPDHHSHLVQILATTSKMAVSEARNGETMVGGKIYIAPPNADIGVHESEIVLSDPESGPGPKPSANKLFTSIAQQYQDRSVAVILSGTGTDGALGIRAVRLAGGVTLVQEPEDAQYDGMPSAAIETRCVDMILPVPEMAASLQQILTQPGRLAAEMESVSSGEASPIRHIIKSVRTTCGVDISYYKDATVERRIQRRMAINNLVQLEEYRKLVTGNKEEAMALSRSVLISVTSFFRDPDAFKELEKVLTTQIAGMGSKDTLRVWVAACATGEEAYSIAILFQEIIANRSDYPELVIFASDMDEGAVDFARVGVYSDDSLANISDAIRQRYFQQCGNAWQVKKLIRQQVVFSVQNIAEDPPFSRMNLVSCRNLLIYLKPNIQKRVFELLHYSLKEGGYLFLGQSESAEQFNSLFKLHSKSGRLYRRSSQAGNYSVSFDEDTIRLRTPRPEGSNKVSRDRRRNTLQELAQKTLTESMDVAWAVVDDNDVVKCLSRDARPLFTLPEGLTILRIFNLLPEALQTEVRGLLYRSRRGNESVRGSRCIVPFAEGDHAYRVDILPVKDDFEQFWVVAFHTDELPKERKPDEGEAGSEASAYISELEQKILFLHQDLQSATEELETSNEELQSQSEELQSSNEELQSMNEQLLTSNEELQSSNEELLTMNDEIRIKSTQLELAASSLSALIARLDYPVIFFDNKLRINWHNEPSVKVAAADSLVLNTPIQNVDWQFEAGDLIRAARDALVSARATQVKVKDQSDALWTIELDLCRREHSDVEGLMLRFMQAG